MRRHLAIFALLAASSACDPSEAALAPIASRGLDVCEAPCERESSCCTERFIHGNGASIGWTRRGTAMFDVDKPEDTTRALAHFKQWIAGSPRRAGLPAAMPNTSPLVGLVPGSTPPRRHGSLVVHRYDQSYRGLPVVGAGEHVSLTISPGYGAVSVSGSVVDARDTYAGWGAEISPAAAVAAAVELFAFAVDEVELLPFEFAAPRLVAVAESRTLAWELAASQGGHGRGTLLVRADNGAMLGYSPDAHYSPDDRVAVQIRVRTFASDFFQYTDPDAQVVAEIDQAPVTGGPLLGSTYTPLACQEDPDAELPCGETRLGNRQVIVLDADHQNFFGDNSSHPHIGASPNGQFLATPPATPDEQSTMRSDAALQDFFYRLQAMYTLIDGYQAGKWDPFRGDDSSFPATKFRPRVILAHHTDILALCGISQPGCTKFYFPHITDKITKEQIYDEHPEGDLPPHVWTKGDPNAEGMGFIGTAVDGFTSPDLVFHEFGHVVDLFTMPGMIKAVFGSGCTDGTCTASCVQDSTDEAEALKETVADMVDLFSVGQLYSTIPYDRCEAVSAITSVAGPVHDPGCMEHPWDIQSFLDQRPVEPAMVEVEGVWLPTGMCTKTPGYRQSGILQAWWEWTHARSCSPQAPFMCDAFADEPSGAASGMNALLFALGQSNATYYRKFFTDMEIHVACTEGPEQASRFRAVFCHHGALDCDPLPPVCPATCGDGIAELTEECDGDDLRDLTCAKYEYSGGTLACKDDCTLDLSPCTNDGATTEGPSPTTPTSDADIPTTDPGPPMTSSETTAGEDNAGGDHADDGCGCRHGANPRLGLFALLLLACRRRRVDAVPTARVQ